MKRVLIASLLLVNGCTSIRPVTSPADFLTRHNPDRVRVVTNGEVLVFSSPFLRRDTVYGFNEIDREDARLPLSALQHMEARQVDRTRTVLLVGGAAAVATAGIVMFAKSGGGQHFFCDSYEVQNRCPARLSLFRIPFGN